MRAIAGSNPAAIPAVRSKSTAPHRGGFSPNRLAWNWIGAAAAFALFLVVGLRVTNLLGASEENVIAGEIESAHVRSLMANHLTDAISTDQHSVKPWFHGKLDYVHERTVASLVYRRQQHPINLFVWPAPGQQDSDVRESARDGYNIFDWTRGGMSYWAISDLAADQMRQFVNLQRR